MRIESLEGRALFDGAFGSAFVCADLPAGGAQQAVTFLPVHAAQETATPGGGTLQDQSPAGTLAETDPLAPPSRTLNRFIRQHYREEFKGLRPGTTAFDAKWTSLAAEQPAAFRAAQHNFIELAYYDVLAGRLDRRYGDALSGRSEAFGEVIWSVAVQHGPKTPLVQRALEPLANAGSLASADDGQLIEAIYDERKREDRRGNLVYFRRSSDAVQDEVRARLGGEFYAAIDLLPSESTPTPTPTPTTPTPTEPAPTPTPTTHPEPTPTATVHLDAPQVTGSWYGPAYEDADPGQTTEVFTVSLTIQPVGSGGFQGHDTGFFAVVGVSGGAVLPAYQSLEHTVDENGVSTFVHTLTRTAGEPILTVTVSVIDNRLTGRWHITPAAGQPYDPATMNGPVVGAGFSP